MNLIPFVTYNTANNSYAHYEIKNIFEAYNTILIFGRCDLI